MDKYLALEKELAELLHPDCVVSLDENSGCWKLHYRDMPRPNFNGFVPRWCRDWADCGPLIAEYGIGVNPRARRARVIAWDSTCYDVGDELTEWDSDHPDKDTAVRFAIVRAAIEKLKATRDTGKDE